MQTKTILIISIIVFIIPHSRSFLSRQKRFVYPPGSAMGLFLALAVPIDIPRKNVFVAYNFEANYVLPNNDTYTDNPDRWIVDEEDRKMNPFFDFNRTVAYKVLESKLRSHGYPGRSCLLRAICETAVSSIEHNGIIGEILHVILSPSSSMAEGLPKSLSQAEIHGRSTGDCEIYHQNCTTSFMDLLTWMGA